MREATFAQIAFLSTDLVQRCGESNELAKLLLDFVLNVAVREDQSWREMDNFAGNRSGERISLSLNKAIWPFELKVRSWIPVKAPDADAIAPMPANESHLREILDTSWLKGNRDAVDLLHLIFGFRQVPLLLDSFGTEIESDLVELLQDPDLVKSVAANPEIARILSEAGAEEIQKIREELDKKKRQNEIRDRNNNFGHAVQEAVKRAVEELGLRLELRDWGYDYEVFPDGASFSFKVGSYFLEVKATTTRDVRLTPQQANTAWQEPDRFVLCVVDLYGQQIKDAWEPADIIPWAKIATKIGGQFEEIHKGVTRFSDTAKPVHLRNEEMLRYGVSVDLWSKGVSIDEWVNSLPRS